MSGEGVHARRPRLDAASPVSHHDAPATLLGSSKVMRRVIEQLRLLAPISSPVLLVGARGAGKTLAARVLHDWSGRDPTRFVGESVGLFAEGLAHDKLVGHVRGAFTGAFGSNSGVFERAHRGTLFLDEIGDASPRLQCALLPLLESRAVLRQGAARAVSFDVRLVFATNVDLEDLVAKRKFRADLLDRMGSFVVSMPSLREHPEDIPELALRALQRFLNREKLPPRSLRSSELERLMAYDWPGNVRELERAMEFFGLMGELPEKVLRARSEPGSKADWNRLAEVMERHNGKVADVAAELGVHRGTVYRHLKAKEPGVVDHGSGG